MSLRYLLSRLLVGLLPLAIISSLYLYLYPIWSACAYPLPPQPSQTSALLNTLRQHLTPHSILDAEPAIFRLLVLADPQLEGDSSLPQPEYDLGARIQKHWDDTLESISTAPFPVHNDVLDAVSTALQVLVSEDLPRSFKAARKRLDLLGNDYYLAHIYRTLHWWTRPTHVTVLGDLIGSQWVTDGEFQRRGDRFWNRVFRGGERVSDGLTQTGDKDYVGNAEERKERLEELPSAPSWAHRIINIVGNHDVGYSGDASERRIERFERVFGRANFDIRFEHPVVQKDGKELTPTLHLINLNSLTLDGPAFSQDIQRQGYTYLNDIIAHRSYPVHDRTTFTLLLTHLPLHKPEGVCTDGPYFTYFDKDDELEDARYVAGGLREQNHLSEHVSANGVLQGIFGMNGDEGAKNGGLGRNGLILTGHDHTGCDAVHYIDRSSSAITNADTDTPTPNPSTETLPSEEPQTQPQWTWNVTRHFDTNVNPESDPATPSVREITLRSMMGDFGGNAGLLSLWFDVDAEEWKYAMNLCPAGVQHVWWAVHVVDLITVLVAGAYILLVVASSRAPAPSIAVPGDKKTR
ncbi:hypothetical protein BJX99DRAFT_10416 [Aspergillus californicus]